MFASRLCLDQNSFWVVWLSMQTIRIQNVSVRYVSVFFFSCVYVGVYAFAVCIFCLRMCFVFACVLSALCVVSVMYVCVEKTERESDRETDCVKCVFLGRDRSTYHCYVINFRDTSHENVDANDRRAI